jgi:predicted TIM-barrel fold metal-dependent hydrolase
MASIMKACQRLALIVLSHASEPVGHLYPGKGKTTPEKLYKFVSQFPENTIVLAHFGGGLPLYALMPEVKQALAKVHFDSAATPYLYTKSIYTTVASILGPEHVLFGSDYPLLGLERPLAYLQGSGLSEKDKGLVLGLNAARLLGLD